MVAYGHPRITPYLIFDTLLDTLRAASSIHTKSSIMTLTPNFGSRSREVERLLAVGNLIQNCIQTVVKEWTTSPDVSDSSLQSWDLFEAQRSLISATGVLVELISNPSMRLMEFCGQYWESRALGIVVAKRIPDILASRSDGVHLREISRRTGLEQGKLGRIMRCLCSSHIFRETKHDIFSNNRISIALVQNEPLRAYIMMFHADLFSCAVHLPRTLFDPKWGRSYSVNETAFQNALDTPKSRWEWLEEQPSEIERTRRSSVGYPGILGEKTTLDSGGDPPAHRPEFELFSMAMVGGGKISGAAHAFDYPWNDLGNAMIVDVGGGVGGFMIELSRRYPLLNFVVQDRAPNVKLAKESIWPKEQPAAVAEGRVRFMVHDFFQTNPIHGADVYWLRYIIHDWSDAYCVKILSAIREAMTPDSRLLVCDQVMDTTVENPQIQTSPLPPNYGVYKRYSHLRDINLMAIMNGVERTPEHFETLFREAGLVLEKIWPCRSQVSILECRLQRL
ncbi:hypothetical protein FQN57_004910 [Myotisia sp. PD_48]|nr:hypothetical protein FQN57_004910 [Myotisia sp. PD_48]